MVLIEELTENPSVTPIKGDAATAAAALNQSGFDGRVGRH